MLSAQTPLGTYADGVQSTDLPSPEERASLDALLATARQERASERGSSRILAYQLLSIGVLPPDPESLIAQVKAGDQTSIEEAIAWLRLDPFCLWSGYLKSRLMRALAQQPLTPDQITALQAVLLDIVPRWRRAEFRDACRLARTVDGQAFRRHLNTLMELGDPDTQQRARWMLEGCERASSAT